MNNSIIELKNGEPIRKVKCISYNTNYSIVIKVMTEIITDGNIMSKETKRTDDISDYYLDGELVSNVNTLVTENVYLNNFNYAIKVVLIQREKGRFDVKNVLVYVKDLNNKNVLKQVRDIVGKLGIDEKLININEDNDSVITEEIEEKGKAM